MAARTSSQNGNWADSSTWGGAAAPGNGDTATVGHVVTVAANATVGHSPGAGDVTQAVLVNAGGSVVINSGVTFVCRGDFFCSNSNTVRSLDVAAGGVFEFDASAAGVPATARYVCQGTGHAASGTQPSIRFAGSSGSHCTVRSNAGGANGRFTTTGTYGGLIEATYTDFTRIGDASNAGFTMTLTGDSLTTFTNCVFDACGQLTFGGTNIVGATQFTMQNCRWKNTAASNCITTTMYNDKTTGTRLIDGNTFDKICYTYAPRECTITNNVFYGNVTMSSTDNEGCVFTGNVIGLAAGADTVQPYAATIDGNYLIYRDSGATNPHFLQVGNYVALTTQAVSNNIFDFIGSDSTGDCILLASPGSAVTVNITNNLVLPNASGQTTGTIFSALGNANITIACNHNTCHVGTGGGAAVGETYTGHAGMLSSFKSNLFWDTSARGYKLTDSGVNDAVSDLVTSANANYNAGYNLSAGSNLKGYNNLEFSSGSPGANDLEGQDPQFIDSSRNMAAWDLSLGGPGTAANALTELLKKNDTGYNSNYNITALLAFVRGGFAPQNTAYRDAGHDGVTIGAFEWQSGRNSGGLCLLGCG